jgi:hypothetical protein
MDAGFGSGILRLAPENSPQYPRGLLQRVIFAG